MAIDTKSLGEGSQSIEELRAALAAAQARIAALAAKQGGKVSFKVSEKGALSVYGLGRFPVTLYRGQWERLMAEETRKALVSFIAANAGKLATKD